MSVVTPTIGGAERNRSRRIRLRETRSGYLFMGPALIHLGVFLLFPILFSLYLSTREWSSPTLVNAPFVGLDNFARLMQDGPFWKSMLNTGFYAVLAVPLGMVVSLAMAVAVNRKLPGINIFRSIFFLPVITSWVAVSVIWITLLSPDSGVVNYLLTSIGLPPQQWLNEPGWAMFALVVIATWKGAGFQMVIWLAGLQSIPEDLYDAAAVDGASGWKAFRHITLPLLFPTTFFLLITGVIGALQVFTPMYVITEGGPLGSTDVAVFHIYNRAFKEFSMGYASAAAWVLFAFIFAITAIQMWWGNRTGQNSLSGDED